MLVPLLIDLGASSGGTASSPPPVNCTWGYASYPALRSSIQQLIDGDDLSTSSISVNILDLIISMGEKRVYRDVRSSTQDTALSLNVTGNSAPLPVDLLELRSAYIAGGKRPLKYLPYEQMQAYIQGHARVAPFGIFYTQEGENLIFWPSLNDGTVISGRYYKYFCSIVTEGLSGNTFFAKYPDLWIYAALVEAIPFIGETSRAALWIQRYEQLVDDVMQLEQAQTRKGSKLQTRVLQ